MWSFRAVSHGASSLVVAAALASPCVAGGVEEYMSFQARLTDNAGIPLEDGLHTLDFFIYDAAVNGNLIGDILDVPVNLTGGTGVVSTPIGPVDKGWFDEVPRFIGLTIDDVDDDPTGDELMPRIRLTAVPFAFRAFNVQPGAVISVAGGEFAADVTVGGALGVGTLTPLAPLHVEGSAATYAGNNTMLLLRKTTPTPIGSDSGFVFQTANEFGQTGDFNTAGIFDVLDGGGNFHALALRVTATGQYPMNTVGYFRGDGNVGIGTTTPGATLNIAGPANPYQGSNTLLLLQKNSSTPVGADAGVVFQVANSLGAFGAYNTAGIFDVLDEAANRHAIAIRATGSGQSPMNTVAYFRGDGNVGIGTTTPQAKVEIAGNGDPYQGSNTLLVLKKTSGTPLGSSAGIVFHTANQLEQLGNYNTAGVLDALDPLGGNMHAVAIQATSSGLSPMNTVAYFRGDGNVGLGTTTPQAKVQIVGSGDPYQGSNTLLVLQRTSATPLGSSAGIVFHTANQFGQLGPYNTSGVFDALDPLGGNMHAVAIQATSNSQNAMNPVAYFRGDGNVGIGTTSPVEKLDVAGKTRTTCLGITGGCDLAERFDVSDARSAVEAIQSGMVLVIDPEHPGKLKLCSDPYDPAVAGIVSGAGGINTGLTLSQDGIGDGEHLVALAGRVYCWCDATREGGNGPIEPGNRLTTSPTPGHAMRATDAGRAPGAVIGKAMSRLPEGRGLVLVLVQPQ